MSTRTDAATAQGPDRVVRAAFTLAAAVAIFGLGMLAGFYLAQPPGGAGAPGGVGGAAGTAAAEAVPADLPLIAQASRYMDLGVAYLEKNERAAAASYLRQALARFEQVIALEPENLYARAYLGLTRYYLGDAPAAIRDEMAVLERDPQYLWALFNLAWIYETTDRPQDALALYRRYLQVAPAEKEQRAKYAEQYALIDRQVEAARKAVERLGGGQP